MPFKDISYIRELLCSAERNHLCSFGAGPYEENFCEIILTRPVVQVSLKDISYLELWWPLCSLEWNHLCNFGRRHHEEQFCEIISYIGTSSSGDVV